MLVLQPFRLHPRLAFRADLPAFLGAFIATDVDVRAGEEVHHLGEHIFQHREYAVIARTEHIIEHAPTALHFVWPTGAAQLRVSCQSRHRMSRHLDLRNYIDVPCLCIGHHLADLLLRVETTVRDAVVFTPAVRPHLTAFAPTTDLGELRVLLDLDPPALVVREVPVETVHLVTRHQVNVFLHEWHREEVAHHVQVHPAPCEARLVRNGVAGNGSRAFPLFQKLDQRATSTEKPFFIGRGQRDVVRSHLEAVPFRREKRIRLDQVEFNAQRNLTRAVGHGVKWFNISSQQSHESGTDRGIGPKVPWTFQGTSASGQFHFRGQWDQTRQGHGCLGLDAGSQ